MPSSIRIEQASSLGLVINELMTNSIKYAFPGDKTGEIITKAEVSQGVLKLVFRDNGVGIPSGNDVFNGRTLGLRLVRSLVEDQLGGTINMESNEGTCFTINLTVEE